MAHNIRQMENNETNIVADNFINIKVLIMLRQS